MVASTVNVLCELAHKHPENYVRLAPSFFTLLTTLNNNWTLIKIVKLVSTTHRGIPPVWLSGD